MGDLGLFQSILIGLATGMAAFFLGTFLAIIGFGIYAGVSHQAVDFAKTYKRVGFPLGLVVGVLALTFLGIQWLRRLARRGKNA